MRIRDLIVEDDPEEREFDDLVLGQDGKVHRAEIARKMSGFEIHMACDATPLRPLGREARFFAGAGRRCPDCQVDL